VDAGVESFGVGRMFKLAGEMMIVAYEKEAWG
jgi:hypothetical protein